MKEPAKLKSEYKIDFNDFNLAKTNYYKFCTSHNNSDYSHDKSIEAFDTFCNKLFEVLDICIQEAKIKEHGDFFVTEREQRIPRVAFETNTTDNNYTLGLFRGFYIVTELKNPQNLKFMKDDFWALLFQLSTLGKFSFKENEKPTKGMRTKAPQLFNKTGNYYKLLRNYFLYETEYGRIRSLGYIAVSWDADEKIETIIPKVSEAFTTMYQLNLLLWRHDNKKVKL